MAGDTQLGVAGTTNSQLVLSFPGTNHASTEHVGGKAHSLIHLASAGLAVPPGVVLTSQFFDPWCETVLVSAEWRLLPAAPADQWRALCESIKQQVSTLPLSDLQQQAMDSLRAQLAALTDSALFAVRSSSPQEDLQGASFAGGYETRLGVRPDHILDAVRTCFASAFDARVFAYKAARGMRLTSPRMAVVVQAQLDSEVAGVAFSLNPLSNDHDEAVIDANWGQGETVVAGRVTPDHWVLEKRSGRIVEHSINDKRLTSWLRPDGGLLERHDYRRGEACLSEDQLGELLAVINRVELLFEHPVDIEWAIAKGSIRVLQARPVTAFVPLPSALMTQPGERRRLYMDVALSSGFTINAPISTMGLDVFRRLASDIVQVALGVRRAIPSGEDALIVLDGGRMYLDLSNVMWLGGPRLMARKMRIADAMVARILESIDPREYRASRRPGWARLRHLWRLPVAGWRMRRLIANSVLPFIASERSHRRIVQQLSAYERELAASSDNALPLAAYWDRYVASRLQTLFDVSMASVGPGVLAMQAFTHLAKPITHNDPELEGKLDRGFAGNVVVDMSIAMQRLARQLPTAQHVDARELEGRLNAGALSASFMEEWDHFLRRFGHRGPMEMDVAHPRYGDAPGHALTQIAAMAVDSDRFDLAAASQRQIHARRVAAAAVIQKAGPIRRRLLQRLHWIIEHFAGMRDTPKHHVLLILHGLRRRLFLEGEQLVRDGRLDTAEQVFDLTIEELIAASTDPELDLRANRDKRLGFYEHLARQVINFPSVIDSRGRILRAPRSTPRDGEFCGVGLSPGIAAGPARTLRSPHEKPLAKGEILIAYTTDPGWTPIFTSAAAVVLEIGGALQHGALVARELGLPCVAGIEGVATAIRDGQLIEVDGSLGTVRLMPT